MSAPRVAVIADSTCYLPSGWAEDFGIGIVPVQVIIGGQSFDETDDDQAQRAAEALAAWQPVTTSRPSPMRFLQAYETAREAGCEEIVVATLSSAMSATYESALLAAKEIDAPVHVVDTRTIAMGLGFAALAGARAASAGAPGAVVADVIAQRALATSVLFYVDTLEYLRRGGRIGAAAALVGSALSVKPLLHVVDGRVETLEKVRTATKALARLEDVAVAAAADADVDVAVHHLANPARAEELATRLGLRIPNLHDVVVSEVGAVVGAHVGPGMLAVVVAPR
jgi:DegV family protein with EDD domain